QAWIGGIRAGSVASCGNHVKASCRWIAFNAEAPGEAQGKGCRARWGGRTCALLLPDVVMDFDFSPFDQFLLATGSADKTVSRAKMQAPGPSLQTQPAGRTPGPTKGQAPMPSVQAPRPSVQAPRPSVQAPQAGPQAQQACTPWTQQTASLHAERAGPQAKRAGPDKKLRIFDPRASPAASQSVLGHEHNKDSRLLWMGSTDCLISVGFSQMREREVKPRDTRQFSKAML
ncbi:Coronin-7, partial [Opisthocomus hoazin]